LTGGFLEDFQTEFDDYMEWKVWTRERVEKATEYAFERTKRVSKFAEEYKKIEWRKWEIGGKWGSADGSQKSRFTPLLDSFRSSEEKREKLLKQHNLLNRNKD
jgi:hypothetical protein